MTDDRTPGMYLVGRDDGTQKELFAKVHGNGTMSLPTMAKPMVLDDFDWDGWWWRLMETPTHLPSQEALDALPHLHGPPHDDLP